MLSRQFVSRRSKNFTSNVSVRMPPPVSVDHYLRSRKPARRDARTTRERRPRPGGPRTETPREGRFRAPARGGDARDRGLVPLFHATSIQGLLTDAARRPARQIRACFEHSNLFKVNVSARRRHPVKDTARQDWSRRPPSTALVGTRRGAGRREGRPARATGGPERRGDTCPPADNTSGRRAGN